MLLEGGQWRELKLNLEAEMLSCVVFSKPQDDPRSHPWPHNVETQNMANGKPAVCLRSQNRKADDNSRDVQAMNGSAIEVPLPFC